MSLRTRIADMFRNYSLTARLTAFYALVSVVVLLGMGGVVSGAVQHHFLELDQDVLKDKVRLIQGIISRAASSTEIKSRLEDALQSHHGLYVLVIGKDGAPLYATPEFQIPQSALLDQSDPEQSISSWKSGSNEYRAKRSTATLSGLPGIPLEIWVAVDTQQHVHFFMDLKRVLWMYIALAGLLSAVLGWWAARKGLSPLRTMKARAQAVTAQKLDERMPAEAVPVEMADLAASLNDMLSRLQNDFQRLSEFSSDLAHELRTPISNLLTQTQVALTQPRDAKFYKEILASNAEEFQRLARMVSDMLLLAKAEHGLLLPSAEKINLADEVHALFDFYEAFADERQILMELSGNAEITGDRLMLRRAISNLLSNALRYTPSGERVRVVIEKEQDATSIAVENTGPDIKPEFLPRLFDRFFREDKSRANPDNDGAGLGLSITRAIADAHGGSVHVTSTQGLTRFVLTFPV